MEILKLKENWLSSMLTKAKQQSTLWVTLADTIQATFETHFGDIEKTIVQNRSLMTMSVEEIKQKQKSLGHFFSVLDAPDNEKGLTLLHRLDQIHLKSTEFPIKDMVRRNFDGLEMDWSPVYAPIDQNEYPYGSRFIAQTEFDELSSEAQSLYFMTSRGRMVLNLNKYLPPEKELQRIYDTISETIVPMIPLDIVFDGFFTQVKIKAVFDIHVYNRSQQSITDSFARLDNINSEAAVSEGLLSIFEIEQDAFSVDSQTRTIREEYDHRPYELLGEQPLGLIPLQAPYDQHQNLYSGLNDKKLNIGGAWASSAGVALPSSNFLSIPASNATIHHIINCELGRRYAVQARKGTDSKCKIVVSESNTLGGEKASVFNSDDKMGNYGATFVATSIAMYIVVQLDPDSPSIASNINVNRLTVI